MRILVTGCSGLVGSHLIETLAAKGYDIVGYDRSKPKYDSPHFVFEEGDLGDSYRLISILNRYKIDCIVHCGGISHPKMGEISDIIQANITGTINIFEAAKKFNIKRVINLSSGAVYGENQLDFTSEESPLRPTSIYGISKLTGEQAAEMYSELYGIEILSLRICFVYGPGRTTPDPLQSILKRLVKGIDVNDIQGSEQKLEFIYIKDLIQCIEKVIELQDIKGRVYNIGSGRSVTLAQITEIVEKLFPNSTIQIGPGTLGYDMIGPFDCSKAKNDLQFEINYSLEDGIKEYIHFLKKEI
ncbi:NAD-dependent epimerase/dehydratase family protein [Domibacillus indicus]|uniref:NAD-dependent epimerase/dehydratase family protein n=1 Tax=Domibacillus indicus TaxID=1437523 RepID=UPI000617FC7E|nr:NAD(P)-dependent oxidoreductase [Domibacillus indicus]